jgi:hypothetical protein
MTTPLPDNLTDDDRLLLHLAGELPEADAATVQQRLRADPAARQFAEAFGHLDGLLRADASALAGRGASAVSAARQVTAALHAAEPPAVATRRRLWLPPKWTAYPAAAAVLLAGLMGGWWYSVRDEYAKPGEAYVDNTPSMLILPGRPAEPLEEVSEMAISRQFDSMIVDRTWDPESPERKIAGQLASLDYLKRVTR